MNLKQLPLVLEDIIKGYYYQLDHVEKFKKTLDIIKNSRMEKILDHTILMDSREMSNKAFDIKYDVDEYNEYSNFYIGNWDKWVRLEKGRINKL